MERVNLKRMSKRTGISIERLEGARRYAKKISIIEKKLEEVTNIRGFKKLYYAASSGSDEEQMILEKWLDRTETPKEICEFHRVTPIGSKIEKEAIIKLFKFYEK